MTAGNSLVKELCKIILTIQNHYCLNLPNQLKWQAQAHWLPEEVSLLQVSASTRYIQWNSILINFTLKLLPPMSNWFLRPKANTIIDQEMLLSGNLLIVSSISIKILFNLSLIMIFKISLIRILLLILPSRMKRLNYKH